MSSPHQLRTAGQPVKLIAVNQHCATLLAHADHAVVGLSPFNSFYSREKIGDVIEWVANHFGRVDVLLPGWEAATPIVANGVTPFAAVRRARQAVQRLRTAAQEALTACGVADADRRVRTWTGLLDREPYRTVREQVVTTYHSDPTVRELCRDTCRAVLARHGASQRPTSEAVEAAVGYVLAEMPLLLNSPAIYGAPTSVFIYHRTPPLVRAIYSGAVPALTPVLGQGFAALTDLTA